MKNVQGEKLAKFYGYYRVDFDDRELGEGRSAMVLILSILKGDILAKTPAAKLPNSDPSTIRRQALETIDILNSHNIFFADLDLQRFLISPQDSLPKMFSFSLAFDGMEYRTEAERKMHAEGTIFQIKHELDSLGYLE